MGRSLDAELETALVERAGAVCELCGDGSGLRGRVVPPGDVDLDHSVLLCERCDAPDDVAAGHWNCLRESIWSAVPAVQVTSWRILSSMDAPWAAELLGEVYLDEETLAWAKLGSASADDDDHDDAAPTLDSNGAELRDGDSVTIIRDLDAKGAGFVAKRGTVVKNIRLTGDPANIEGRVNKTVLVLKTKFLKKV